MGTFLGGKCSAELSKALSACESNDVKLLAAQLKEKERKLSVFNKVTRMSTSFGHNLFDKYIQTDNHLCFELLFLFVVKIEKQPKDNIIDRYHLMIRTLRKLGNKKCFEYLISVCYDIDGYLTDRFCLLDLTPLQMACIDDDEMAVKLLLKYGANVNRVDLFGNNLMHIHIDQYNGALRRNGPSRNVLLMLLMAGTDACWTNGAGFMPGENSATFLSCIMGKIARSHSENCY